MAEACVLYEQAQVSLAVAIQSRIFGSKGRRLVRRFDFIATWNAIRLRMTFLNRGTFGLGAYTD